MLAARRVRPWVALAFVAGVALRFWRLGELPLHSDEAYYFLWSQHLAPGFFDNPAGMAFFVRLSTLIAGETEVGIRLLTALVGALTVPLAYLVGRRYVNQLGGLAGALGAALAPVFVITGRLAYPDALQHFLLLATLLALPLPGGRGDPIRLGRWLLAGVCMGLFLNIKLTSIILPVALVLYLVAFRRELLRSPGPWLAVVVAGLLWTPFLAWSAGHGWSSVRLALEQAQGYGLGASSLPGRLLHIVTYHSPAALAWVLVALAGGVYGVVRARRSTSAPSTGAYFLMVLCLLFAAPVLFSAADNPRNLSLALLTLLPLAGLWADRKASARPAAGVRAVSIPVAVLAALALALGVYGVGTAAGLLGDESLPRSSAVSRIVFDAAAWPAFGATLGRAEDASPLFAVDYSIAGQVSYYARKQAYTSSGQYRIWGIPPLDHARILALDVLPPDIVDARVRKLYSIVEGPNPLEIDRGGVKKKVYVWEVEAPVVSQDALLEGLDYLRLAREFSGSG